MPEQTPAPATPAGEEIGRVVGFFAVPSAAILEITQGSLKVGEKIWIRGHTTDLIETISSMQIDRAPISEAEKGQQIGVKVSGRVRRHDRVYKIP